MFLLTSEKTVVQRAGDDVNSFSETARGGLITCLMVFCLTHNASGFV